MDFPSWINAQPYGTLKRLERQVGAAYVTLHRLKRGERIDSYDLAARISKATGGEVSIDELCAPKSEPAEVA